MLRTTSVGIASALVLGIGLAAPAGAMGGGHMGGGGGGGAMHAGGGGGGGGGGAMHAGGGGGGGAMHVMGGATGISHSGMMATRSSFSPGGYAPHDMGRMRMGDHDHDFGRHDHDHGRHDHDHFRFFPAFAFGADTYTDVYDPTYSGCLELRRIPTHAGWRWRRVWVCG
jgi:hypothetical protein